MCEDLYSLLNETLSIVEMPVRAPAELSDPMAVAEFTDDILNRCQENIHADLNCRPTPGNGSKANATAKRSSRWLIGVSSSCTP